MATCVWSLKRITDGYGIVIALYSSRREANHAAARFRKDDPDTLYWVQLERVHGPCDRLVERRIAR